MADDEPIHDAVKLLLARMDSHPEEFVQEQRWALWRRFALHWNATERALFAARRREICMQVMHEELLKELMK